jgi:hypothetical protein
MCQAKKALKLAASTQKFVLGETQLEIVSVCVCVCVCVCVQGKHGIL